MATKYGVERTKINSAIPQLAEQGTRKSGLCVLRDKYTLTADLAQGDVIKLGKLPEGATVLDVAFIFADLDGSGGTIDIGWLAGDAAVEAADSDGFLAAVDVTSAGSVTMQEDQSTTAGFYKTFAEEVEVVATTIGDTDATTGSIYVIVTYVVD